jgi:hypothetical protein
MSLRTGTGVVLAALLLSVLGRAASAGESSAGDAASPAGAQDRPLSWSEVKCTRYKEAWSQALQRKGSRGLGTAFVERHDAFLASGCTADVAVCPRSEEELAMANLMILASMNAGMASTFAPFSCRK